MTRVALLVVLTLACPLFGLDAQEQETFELPEWSADQRWNRAGQLGVAAMVGWLAHLKAEGMSADAMGEELGRTYGPPRGWNGADSPWRLFRGMAYNWMSMPGQTVEVLEAGDAVVRARLGRPYLEDFQRMSETYGVSVEEYEKASEVFGRAIAEHHGMSWEQEVDGDHLILTIRKR